MNEVVASTVWKRKEKKVRKEKVKKKKATRDVTSNLVPVGRSDQY